MIFDPRTPEAEPAPTDQNITISLSPHGMVIDIKAAFIKAGIMAAGVWLATKSGMDAHDAQTYIGGLITIGAAYILHGSIQGANELTKKALGAK